MGGEYGKPWLESSSLGWAQQVLTRYCGAADWDSDRSSLNAWIPGPANPATPPISRIPPRHPARRTAPKSLYNSFHTHHLSRTSLTPISQLPHLRRHSLHLHLRTLLPPQTSLHLPLRPLHRIQHHLPLQLHPIPHTASLRIHGLRHLHHAHKSHIFRYPRNAKPRQTERRTKRCY